MYPPALLLAALTPLLIASTCSAQANLVLYPIDWSAVPTNPPAKNLTFNCICDLNPQTCSPNCCCDPECPLGVVAVATAAGSCLPQGPPDQTLDYCTASSSVQKVNLPSGSDFYVVNIQAADQKFFDQLLCIVNSQNPNLGENYPDPTPGASGINANLAGCPVHPSTPSRSTLYQLSSPLFVLGTNSSSTSVPLTVPYPAWSMECMDAYQPGFMQPLPASQQNVFSECLRNLNPDQPSSNRTVDLKALRTQCLTNPMLSATTFANLLFPTAPPTGVTTLATVTTSTTYLDPKTGDLLLLNYSPSPLFLVDTCYFALQYINLTFVYTVAVKGGVGVAAQMQLVEVFMSLVVTDFNSSALGSAVMMQAVRIDFQELGGSVVLQNSGNPGYLTGFPLLAGALQVYQDPALGKKTAIQRLTFGLPLPAGDLSGRCSPLGLAPVRFGFNATSSCTVPLNLLQLKAMCNESASVNGAYLLSTVLGTLYDDLISNLLYVGVWGNANYTSPAEWVQVIQNPSTIKTPLWIDAQRGCGNLVTGFDLQVVTGVAFAANNLQRKVLYVNLCYRPDTWLFPPNLNANVTLNFQMTSTVSFVALPQSSSPSIKPHPPLGIPLPEDIFYPFVTNAAAGPGRSGGALALAVQALLVLVAVLCLAGGGV